MATRAARENDSIRDALRLTHENLEQIEALTRTSPRRAATMLAALRLKLEYGHGKPAQAHEHSALVQIVVHSALAGAPGSAVHEEAKALPVATGPTQALCFEQGLITALMTTPPDGGLSDAAHEVRGAALEHATQERQTISAARVDACTFDL